MHIGVGVHRYAHTHVYTPSGNHMDLASLRYLAKIVRSSYKLFCPCFPIVSVWKGQQPLQDCVPNQILIFQIGSKARQQIIRRFLDMFCQRGRGFQELGL